MFLTQNPFSDHGPSKKVLSEAFKYHIPEDIPANERTAFHGAAAAAAKAGKKNFNFGGKTHPVTMKKDTAKAIPTEAVKYPHMMYDPKTGKEVTAKTPMDHAKFAKMGYTHEKPKMNEISKSTLDSYIKKADADKSKKHVRADVGKISRDDAYKNQVKRNKGIELAKAKMKPAKVPASEATVKEISKGLAKRYVGKAARDVYFKGRSQATKDAISQLGGPDTDYKKSPERKAAMRMRGIDRATNRLAKKEAMSDAEKAAHQKAIDAFKAKGGKIKKLKPGFAQGYHGKSDPGAGMKGMISPADTKQFGTKKKIGSMK